MIRRLSTADVLVVVLLSLVGLPAVASADMPQGRAGDPPSSLAVKPTRTGHEIGAGTHLNVPFSFIMRFRYRYIFAGTAAQGPLSGFWIEPGIGPALDDDPEGNIMFNLGYEFAPWSNLALTFSPVLRNDFFFDDDHFAYQQTYGGTVRLYFQGNWVFFVNPFAFGFRVSNRGCCSFAWQGGAGFGYKF